MTLRGKVTAALALAPLAFLCAVCPTLALASGASSTGAYTVTVPTEVSVGEPLTVTSDLPAQSNLDIKLTSTDDAWKLRNGGASVGYDVSSRQLQHSATNAQTFTDNLSVTISGAPACSGTYTDTLTFSFDFRVNEFALTFDAGAGALPAGTETERQVEYGASLGTLPEPTREGYQFAGWFDAAEGGTRYTDASIMPAQAVTLYARWTANAYTVKFDANAAWGGKGSVADLPMTYDAPAALPTGGDVLTNANAEAGEVRFDGWNTKADGTGQDYADKAEVTNLTSENNGSVTLYAQWEFKHTLTVQYDTSVVIDVTKYATKPYEKWLRPGQSLVWSALDLLDLVDEGLAQTEKNWNDQWGNSDWSNVKFPDEKTTSAAAGKDSLTLNRKTYYLDLNGSYVDLNGKTHGGGNLKEKNEETGEFGETIAKANVYVNGKLVTPVGGDTDYFKRQKFGATFRMELIAESLNSRYTCTTSPTVIEGIVTNKGFHEETSTENPNGYYYTGITYRFKEKASSSSTSDSSSSSESSAGSETDAAQASDAQDASAAPADSIREDVTAAFSSQDADAASSEEEQADGAAASDPSDSTAGQADDDAAAVLPLADVAFSAAGPDVLAADDAPDAQGE